MTGRRRAIRIYFINNYGSTVNPKSPLWARVRHALSEINVVDLKVRPTNPSFRNL